MTTSERQGIPKRLGAVAFYTDILRLQLKLRGPTPGQSAAFLSAGDDSSHELALMPLPAEAEGLDVDRVGMYHMAWEMGSFEELEQLHERLKARDVTIVATAKSSATSCSSTSTATNSKRSGSPLPISATVRRSG